MTRQVTDQLYIDLGYLTPEDYYVYLAEAKVDLTPYIEDGYIEANYYEYYGIQSTLAADLTAVEGEVEEAQAVLTATVQVTVSVSVTRTAASSQTVSASQTTVSAKIADILAPLGTAFSATMSVEAVRITEVTLQSFTALTTDFVANRSAQIALENLANISAQADRSAGLQSNLSVSATQTTAATKSTATSASFNSTASSAVQAQTTKTSSVTLNVQAVIACDITRINRNIGSATLLGQGQVEISSAQKKFGSASARFYEVNPGTTFGTVKYPYRSDWNDFKNIDFWIRVGSYNGNSIAQIPIIGQSSDSTSFELFNWIVLFSVNPSNTSQYRFGVRTYRDDGNSGLSTFSTYSFSVNTWYHVRVAKDSNTFSLYVDGTRYINQQTATGIGTRSLPLLLGPTFFGSINATDTYRNEFYLDEIRITDEQITAPSASSITVPSSEFTNTDLTDILLHFNSNFEDDNSAPPRTVSAVLTANSQSTVSATAVKTATVTVTALNTGSLTADCQVIANGEVSLSSESTVSAAALRIFPLSAEFDSIASQVTAVARVADILVLAETSVAMSVTADAVIDSVIAMNSEASQTTENSRTRAFDAAVSTELQLTADGALSTENPVTLPVSVAQTADNDRIRSFDFSRSVTASLGVTAEAVKDSGSLSYSASASQTAIPTITRTTAADFQTIASQITVSAKIGDQVVQINTDTALTANAEVTATATADLTSTTAVSALAGRILETESSQTVQAQIQIESQLVFVTGSTESVSVTLTLDNSRTRAFDSQLSSQAALSSVVNVTTDNSVSASSSATVAVDNSRTRQFDSVANSVVTATADADAVLDAVITAQTESAVTVDGTIDYVAEAQLPVTANLTAEARKTASFIVFEPVVVLSSATGTVIRGLGANLDSNCTQTTANSRTRNTSTEFVSIASQLTVGSGIKVAVSMQPVTVSMTVTGSIIIIDPDLTYVIPRETRTYTVVNEQRLYTVLDEDREYII